MPDPEEIRYTQRMFAVREEEAAAAKQEPIRLPAPVRPSDQPQVIFAPPPRAEIEPASKDELAQRLVETARTRYTPAQSEASYRPVSEAVKPYTPPQQATQTSAPRVFDYKKQPKAQPTQKPSVTRIQKSGHVEEDDEE